MAMKRKRENNGNFSRLLRKIKSNPLERELGFGKNLALDARLMNPDGSFNVEREQAMGPLFGPDIWIFPVVEPFVFLPLYPDWCGAF
jgi:hypothetical protein